MSETSHKLHTTFQNSAFLSFFLSPKPDLHQIQSDTNALCNIFDSLALPSAVMFLHPTIHPSILHRPTRSPTTKAHNLFLFIAFCSSMQSWSVGRFYFAALVASRRYTTLVSIIHLRSNDCCSSHCKSLSFFFPSPILTFSLPPSLPHLTTYLPRNRPPTDRNHSASSTTNIILVLLYYYYYYSPSPSLLSPVVCRVVQIVYK